MTTDQNPEPSTCSCTGTRAGLNACVHCPTPWPELPGAIRMTRPGDVAAGIAPAFGPTELGTPAASPNATGGGVGALCHCGLGTKEDCATQPWGCGPNGEHGCANCEGIDPGSCLMNPGRAATLAPSPSRDTMREAIAGAIDAVFERWTTGLGETRPQDALTTAVLAAPKLQQLRAKVQRLTSDLAETAGLEETAADRYQNALHWQERAEEAEARVAAALALHNERFCYVCRDTNCETRTALTAPTGPAGQGDGGGK